jgi:hypothetical protein
MAEPIPERDVVSELGSENRPAPPPAPTDFHHVHRRLERLLVVLEQQGVVVGDDLHHIRHTP